jgi:hypothetical protein
VSRCGWIAPPSSSQNEGTGASPGTGGALAAPVPQLIPGVVETLFQPIAVTDLFATVQATGNTVR